jgi:hypothetical protein
MGARRRESGLPVQPKEVPEEGLEAGRGGPGQVALHRGVARCRARPDGAKTTSAAARARAT